jgi:hypothetical protein
VHVSPSKLFDQWHRAVSPGRTVATATATATASADAEISHDDVQGERALETFSERPRR